jgi:ADP-dependent NAD(P)H-hydrate dehydratase
MNTSFNDPHILDADLLRAWQLPMPAPDADKGARGQVLVIGGSREMPGAVILAATAALRAGAGKLTVATGASVAQLVASAIPESRVIGLPETAAGGIANGAADLFDDLVGKIDAVLIGPGMQDEPAVCVFAHALLKKFIDTPIVLDACAMSAVRGTQAYQEDAGNVGDTRLILTPHAGEMAHLLGDSKEVIQSNAYNAARDAAKNWNAVVALKGGTTFIASPDGDAWQHDGGNVGLATSGSGDVLAGIIAGLVARGATVQQATAWGVLLHAQAGDSLAKRIGPIGYLAREIADEIPGLLHKLAQRNASRKIVT